VIVCNAYQGVRTQYISTYYYRRPSMYKFKEPFWLDKSLKTGLKLPNTVTCIKTNWLYS